MPAPKLLAALIYSIVQWALGTDGDACDVDVGKDDRSLLVCFCG